jgi:hypothetical protein
VALERVLRFNKTIPTLHCNSFSHSAFSIIPEIFLKTGYSIHRLLIITDIMEKKPAMFYRIIQRQTYIPFNKFTGFKARITASQNRWVRLNKDLPDCHPSKDCRFASGESVLISVHSSMHRSAKHAFPQEASLLIDSPLRKS